MYTVYSPTPSQLLPSCEQNMSCTSYSVTVLDQPLPGTTQEEISCLLLVDRPEFGQIFGADHRERLAAGTGLVTAVVKEGDLLVSHACMFYDAACPDVGLLAHVFTLPEHRRRGLSTLVCQALLQSWKMSHSLGSVVVLGTGSPHAAKVYQMEGFTHLLGGLDECMKGYNVDDMGEWIMVRDTLTMKSCVDKDKDPFHTRFFTDDPKISNFSLEPLTPSQLPGLVVLFTSNDKRRKMVSIGIDTGLEAEEALLKLMMEERLGQGRKSTVVVHHHTKHIHGLAVQDSTMVTYYAATTGAAELIETLMQDGKP